MSKKLVFSKTRADILRHFDNVMKEQNKASLVGMKVVESKLSSKGLTITYEEELL